MGNFLNKLILISSRVSNPLNKMDISIVFGMQGSSYLPAVLSCTRAGILTTELPAKN